MCVNVTAIILSFISVTMAGLEKELASDALFAARCS